MRSWRFFLGGLGAALLTAYWCREALLLEAVGLASRFSYTIGEHRSVDWERGPSTPEGSPRPPNIILIVADDLGWNDLSFAGGGVAGGTVPTPHIDAIAHEGASFSRGYAAHGTCAPSRAALMSGRYPTRFGYEFTPTPPAMLGIVARLANARTSSAQPPVITYFDQEAGQALPYEAMGMPAQETTLAEVLSAAGYYTAHIGKWHLGRERGMAPQDQGFDQSLLMHSGLYLPESDPDVVNAKLEFDPIDRFLWQGMRYAASYNGGEAFEPAGYLTDYYTDEAVKVIEANSERPFFLYLAHWAPHTPLQATREDYDTLAHIDNHRLRVYAAMIRALDRGVGEVMDALKRNGLDANTLVMFTSDNGGAGYVGLPELNSPYRGWKITLFEGGIRVPFLMRWPARIPPGSSYHQPVHHFDLFASALAAAGASVPPERPIDGVNLMPYVVGDLPTQAPHEALYWRSGHYQVVQSQGWKLSRADRPEKLWLFDLRADPTEQTNLAGSEPGEVARLLALLDTHSAAQAVSAWPARIESPVRIDKTINLPWAGDDEYVYWPN